MLYIIYKFHLNVDNYEFIGNDAMKIGGKAEIIKNFPCDEIKMVYKLVLLICYNN